MSAVEAQAVEMFRRARSILFITGAGISADSGLPTYRGVGGLYDDADTEDGVPIEVALSGPMFRARPDLTWKHIASIERLSRAARPNRAHQVIAALERAKPRVWTLTQNVDGLHQAAGAENVIAIHGDVRTLVCTGCGDRRVVQDFAGLALPPRCARCGAVIRPAVVLFEEGLPEDALRTLYRELEQGFELVVSIGTSSLFPYIAAPVFEAAEAGRMTLEINPGETVVSPAVDLRWPARAAEAMEVVARGLGV